MPVVLAAFLQSLIVASCVMLLVWFVQVATSNRLMRVMGRRPAWFFCAPGIICHELSHALMCFVFFHRITSMSLVTYDPQSATLGYVHHIYRTSSFYQRLGLLYIGLAPFLLGPLVILLGAQLLLPEPDKIFSLIRIAGDSIELAPTFTTMFSESITLYLSLWDAVLELAKDSLVLTTVWLAVSGSIAIHCAPSPADLRSAATGLAYNSVLVIVCGSIAVAAGWEWPEAAHWLGFAASLYLLVIALCLVWWLVLMGISIVISAIKRTTSAGTNAAL
ncbi:hypothetical protein K0504_09635 [Neiella marina]|uniref:Integral membrane protein n=1 Tax=Neiella holothuriorum TaxID=2870530 RepID=A0ABS7EG37_9GAMM|nr:hypothetical protein [Neiella holothuriorum]MBW8191297.1 hypothetical protein [Neiella holothuriorum]